MEMSLHMYHSVLVAKKCLPLQTLTMGVCMILLFEHFMNFFFFIFWYLGEDCSDLQHIWTSNVHR